MENIDGNNTETGNTMSKYLFKKFLNKETVFAYGNKYHFDNPIVVNDAVSLGTCILSHNRETFHEANGLCITPFIEADLKINLFDSNNKKHVICGPSWIYTYEDLSIRDVYLGYNNEELEPLEGIYLSKLKHEDGIGIQNHYIFDKEENITDVKRIFTFIIHTKKKDHFKSLKDKCIPSEEKSKLNLSEEESKLDLLNKINDKAIENGANVFQITFDGNKAYALIEDKLYFSERKEEIKKIDSKKKEEEMELPKKRKKLDIKDKEKVKPKSEAEVNPKNEKENVEKIEYSEYNPKGKTSIKKKGNLTVFLTAFKDKALVAYSDYDNNKAGILVFNSKDRKFESDTRLKSKKMQSKTEATQKEGENYDLGEVRTYISMFNPDNPGFTVKDINVLSKKIKKYFDKRLDKEGVENQVPVECNLQTAQQQEGVHL